MATRDDMTYEERIDAVARDPSLSRADRIARLRQIADEKIDAQDVRNTQGGLYQYRPPAAVNNSPAVRYGSPSLIPTSRSRSARLGSDLGDAVGRFGSGFIEGYKGQSNANQVAQRAHDAILQTQRVSARQAAEDRAGQVSAVPLSTAFPHDGGSSESDSAPVTRPERGSYSYSPPASAPSAAPVRESTSQEDPNEVQMYGDERDSDPALVRSDRRSKEDVSKAEAREMLRKAPAYSYEYRRAEQGPISPPGRKYGVMAQDLEKTPAGRQMVETDPRTGRKTVNYGQGLGAMMAGLSALADDVERLKDKGGRK